MLSLGKNRWVPFGFLLAAFATALAAALELEVPCWQASACRDAMDYRLWNLPVAVWGCLFDAALLFLWACRRRFFLCALSAGMGIEVYLLHTLHRAGLFCPLCILHAILLAVVFLGLVQWNSGLPNAATALAASTLFLLADPLGSSPPVLYAAADSSSPTVAVAAGVPITLSQLDGAVAGDIFRLERQIHDLRRRKLDEIIEGIVVAKEAKKRDVSPEDLYRTAVRDVSPTQEELDFYVAANRDYWDGPYRDEEELRNKLRLQLVLEKREQAWKEFVRSLYDKYGVSISLPDPSSPTVVVDTREGIAVGPPNAPVTVVEFSDYQCPVCREAHKAVEELMEETRGEVRWVFMDYPLRRHKQARKAAEAARCAADQGRFPDYRNALYAAAGPDALTPKGLLDVAASLGLNTTDFRRCLESGRHAQAVEENLQEARARGIDAIPAFVVNGRLLLGFPGKETLAAEIAKARSASATRIARASR
ncbi:Thioredoxin [Desulfacinum infernum DSM 9756]|uniref:Thioredoxin n=1 Tax=Desulfacinum infernum DSM 9756 TaxID=1121391 RepID=A0A1M4XC61_9BACT|nr:thioredoxin domain-containing protein [Desulfacinum infernum]SHE90886.1 Thioredoxin [Desulfacinum infernum DSM 9756]